MTLKHYRDIFKQVVNISVSSMLVYRGNVVFLFVFETLFFVTNLLVTGIGLKLAGGTIAGWSSDEIYLLTAFNNVTHQFFICFMIGPIFSLPYDIAQGKMDYVLLKPLPTLTSVFATHEFTISNIPNFLLSLIFFGYFMVSSSLTFTPLHFVFFLVAAVVALAVRVCIAIVTIAPCFFAEKTLDGENGFWNVVSLSKYPLQIYPGRLQWVFTTVLPLGLIVSFPSEILLGRKTLLPIAVTLGVGIIFIILTRYFFYFCVKSYKSTNA